jgi:predicted transposase/invertase (TIGR01784 family)
LDAVLLPWVLRDAPIGRSGRLETSLKKPGCRLRFAVRGGGPALAPGDSIDRLWARSVRRHDGVRSAPTGASLHLQQERIGIQVKHCIDPTVDCVFKALLGSPRHSVLLLDFLNGVLAPESPIAYVQILNPYNEREFVGDKLTIVDVKATDEQGVIYQVEIQLRHDEWLPARMLHNWSDIYQQQLVSGDDYDRLRAVVSIWILQSDLLPQSPAWHHQFRLHDPQRGVTLTEHVAVHILELSKWKPSHPLDGRDRWLYFFKHAHEWRELPKKIDTPEMRRAMAVLREFSEKQLNYFKYMSRREAQLEQRTIENRRRKAEAAVARLEEKQARLEEKQARLEEEKVRAEEEKAQLSAETARLRALLVARGLDPDSVE